MIGVARDDLRLGYRSIGVNSHRLFYRLDGDDIELIRVLHMRMDFGGQLDRG
jgi:toxin ParE1/3/4